MKLKYVLCFVIAMFLPIVVNAATGTGICYEKNIISQDGYCKLDHNLNISSTRLPQNVGLSGGIHLTAAQNNYIANYNGTSYDMFCIDNNLSGPTVPYTAARAVNLKNDFDKNAAKAYQLYVNASVFLLNNGTEYNAAFDEHLQDLNIVLRALTVKWGFDRMSTDYQSVVKQLEGQPTTGAVLVNKSGDHLSVIKRWYCSAALACTNCNYAVGLSKTNLAKYCEENVPGTSTWLPSTFEVKFTGDTENIKTEYNSDLFTKTIPVKITGLSKFSSDKAFANTNPYVYIKKVTCSDNKLTCSLEDSSITETTDILKKTTGDDYTVNLKVTGKVTDFKSAGSAKVKVTYQTYHILDARNLSVVKYTAPDLIYQRMFVVMPLIPQTADVDINLALPSVCNATIEGGVQVYKYGEQILSSSDYLQKGCCDVDPAYLTSEFDKKYFEDNCQTEDIVHLEADCGQTCETTPENKNYYSHSYVYQYKMDKLLSRINNTEKQYVDGGLTFSNLTTEINKTTSNYRDDVYPAISTGSNAISSGNKYCMMYTSENNDIYYPTTTTATSGRFFVFSKDNNGNYTQPYVNGSILANFHTSYDVWEKDYIAAINDEKNKYDAWQKAAALENAISKLTSCYTAGNCGCCNPTTNSAGVPSCTGGCYTYYGGSNTKYADSGKFYDKDGRDLSNISATQSCGCSTNSRTPSPSPSAAVLASIYSTSRDYRKNLEIYKQECEAKSTNLDNQWNYYLEPDLDFNYQQTFLNDRGVRETITMKIPMVVSNSSVKYWPNISTNVSTVSSTGSVRNKSIRDSYGKDRHNGIYTININVDTNEDYSVKKAQTLFYRPNTYYYSLVPSGSYVTEAREFQSIELGYVFNIKITNYQGEYLTWFTINNVGHLKVRPAVNTTKLVSNAQNSLNRYLQDYSTTYTDNSEGVEIDSSAFSSKCYYCDETIIYEPTCLTCDDFTPLYIYRTITMNDLNPNERNLGTNWSSAKGIAAEEQIEALGASGAVYDDNSEFLEYDFTLNTQDMQKIKDYNKNTNYADFSLSCNSYGKECTSSFVETWADFSGTTDLLNNTRANKWKYFVNGVWHKGIIGSIAGLSAYPDADAELPNWP